MELLVRYHFEDGFYDAECPQVPELVAGDPDLAELRSIVRDALTDALDRTDLTFVEMLDGVPLAAAVR